MTTWFGRYVNSSAAHKRKARRDENGAAGTFRPRRAALQEVRDGVPARQKFQVTWPETTKTLSL
jgi:hypothetical protein